MSHKLDMSLARRCAERDPAALEELVDEHYSAVLNFVYRFTGVREEAQDLAQEVFVKALGALDRFDGRSSLRTWLFTIAANAARDALRHRRRQREVTPDEAQESQLAETPDPSPDARPEVRAVRTLRSALVRRMVLQLPEAHRMTVILRFYHDHSLQEIAEICGCSMGTVGSRLHYAMRKLNAIVDADRDAREEFDVAEGGHCS